MQMVKINDWEAGRRPAFNIANIRKGHGDLIEPEFWAMAEIVWDYTMCGVLPLYNLYSSLRYIFDNRIEGDIIECGVLLGGCTMLIEKMCMEYDFSQTRRVFALDTFSGFVRRILKWT